MVCLCAYHPKSQKEIWGNKHYGCMFAGKTTELIRRVQGKNVLAFKPKLDYR